MAASEQVESQLERALRKVIARFPAKDEADILTDIYLQVKQESGEVLVFDDNDEELTRCVIEEWIDNRDEDFYEKIQPVLCRCLQRLKEPIHQMGILKPFSFVLTGEERETLSELYLVDDETILINGELMKDLEDDLNKFLSNLLKE